MPDMMKNALIGLFVLAALSIFIFIVFFLHPSFGNEGQTIVVRFVNIDKITVGTRVTFAGRPVGEVIAIYEVEAPRDQLYHGGYVYAYELILKIDSNIEVFNTDEISIRSSGLLGEKAIAIIPLQPKTGQQLHKISGKDIHYASESGTLESTFAEFNDFARKAEETLDRINEQLDDIKKEGIWHNVGSIMRHLRDITAALDEPEDWNSLLKNWNGLGVKANDVADRILNSWDRVDSAITHIGTATSDIAAITTDTRRGQGTLGRLLNTDDMYLRFSSILSKGETLMDDMNHYGILFHLDKSWQRMRARRMNLLQQLRCPQEFRNFFEDEIDQINTSLSRVYAVLRETECICAPEDLLCDCDFVKLFAELMRRIVGLEESIQMYNIQMVELHEECRCR